MIRTLFSTMRAKITPLWTKLRLWLNPTFWGTRGISTLRGFFFRLFDIKPRDKRDYYPVFRWLISKRLAFAIVISVGIVGMWYILIMSPLSLPSGLAGDGIPAYRYNSLPLKFYDGAVRILAKDGQIAYVGTVKDGFATGDGSLYDAQGALLYSGAFEHNMFEGIGKLYYPDGTVAHAGSFSNNLFHGEGEHFSPAGTLEYKGSYVNGLRSGYGELFNLGGNKIFSGSFQADQLVYAQFVGKLTQQAAELYTGESIIYSSSDEYCVEMREIGAVYSVRSGANNLEEEWTVERLYVLSSSLLLGGKSIDSIAALTASLGMPDYAGLTWTSLPDAVSLNLLEQDQIAPISMKMEAVFDDVYSISEYNGNSQVYLYVFKINGLVYTFYCGERNATGFLMYSIE